MSTFTIKLTSGSAGKLDVEVDTDDEVGTSLAAKVGLGMISELIDDAEGVSVKRKTEVTGDPGERRARPLARLPLPLRAIEQVRYSGVMIYESHGIPRAELDALVEQGWLRLELEFYVGDHELENGELNDDGSVTDLDYGHTYPKDEVSVTRIWLTTDKVLGTTEHHQDSIKHDLRQILSHAESAGEAATALGDVETLKALVAIKTLTTVVQRRCELKTGP